MKRSLWLILLGAAWQLSACGGLDDDPGARIFRDGVGGQGRLAYDQGPDWLRRRSFGCAVCHGVAGEGRSVRAGQASGAAPAITAAELAARGYDAPALRVAIRDGRGPDGRVFSYYMPRWRLDDGDMQALMDYLSRL